MRERGLNLQSSLVDNYLMLFKYPKKFIDTSTHNPSGFETSKYSCFSNIFFSRALYQFFQLMETYYWKPLPNCTRAPTAMAGCMAPWLEVVYLNDLGMTWAPSGFMFSGNLVV